MHPRYIFYIFTDISNLIDKRDEASEHRVDIKNLNI